MRGGGRARARLLEREGVKAGDLRGTRRAPLLDEPVEHEEALPLQLQVGPLGAALQQHAQRRLDVRRVGRVGEHAEQLAVHERVEQPIVRAQQRVPLALVVRLRPAGARAQPGGGHGLGDLRVELRDVPKGGGGEV